MRYPAPHQPYFANLLTVVTYGSHLYGTSSPKSDHDFKAVYLPFLNDLLLAKQPKNARYRFDADGAPVPDNE